MTMNTSYSNYLWSVVLLLLTSMGCCHDQNGCGGQKCGRNGPPIRFPFRLKGKEPPHCGYPGFDLTCDNNHHTVFEVNGAQYDPPIQLHVTSIQYKYNYFVVTDPQNCLPRQLIKLYNYSSSSVISPFLFNNYEEDHLYKQNISFFNCFPDAQYQLSCPIYAAADRETLLSSNLVSCTKMFDITSNLGSTYTLNQNRLDLWWSKPDCRKCENQGKSCKLNNNGTHEGEVECWEGNPKPISKILLAATGVVGGSILVVLVVTASFKIYHHLILKGEDRARIDKFLEDYKAFKPTRFSYADIKRITYGFKDKLGEGAHGAVFKGIISQEIPIALKMLNNMEDDGKDFINEVGTMGKIHHVNVVRLLGYCAEGFHRALVYDFFPKGSLQNFISPPDNKVIFLGWDKLHQIAVGVARGIEYLHQGCDKQILHFDINPHNVLLDDNLAPKITDFGLAKMCSKNQSVVSMTAARGTLGFIAPEVVSRNFGNVSHKSDIYSYGMLLLEMVGGRKNTDMVEVESPFKVLYPEWMHNLLDGGDIHIDIENEEDVNIAKKIAIVGLWCIQWNPVNRPSIKTVLQMLEGDLDKLKVPHDPFHSKNSTTTNTNSTTGTRAFQKRLDFNQLEAIEEND